MILDNELRTANEFIRNNNYTDALNVIEKMEDAFPEDTAVLFCKAYLYMHKGEYAPALGAITKAINIQPNDPSLYFTRARCFLELGMPEKTIADCDQTIMIESEVASVYHKDASLFFKAEALFRLGRKEEALAICKTIPPDVGWWLGDSMRTAADIIREIQ